jgi:hypothetical protein
MPQRIIETAIEWNMYKTKNQGNLGDFNPVPDKVYATGKAKSLLMEYRAFADEEYKKAESRCDESAKAIWGRANEQARKISLIYAGSESYKAPEITLNGAKFGTEFIDHQVRRMLYLADTHVIDNEFDGKCKKVIAKLKTCSDQKLRHSPLLKFTRWKAKELSEVVDTLIERGDLIIEKGESVTKASTVYQLTN